MSRQSKIARDIEKFTVCGFDLRDVLRALWFSRTMRAARRAGGPRALPALTISRSRTRAHTTGRAWRSRLHLTVGLGAPAATVLEVLAHEVAHLGPVPRVAGRRQVHGASFRKRLAALVCEVYGVDRAAAKEQNQITRRAYAFDTKLAQLIAPELPRLRELFHAPAPVAKPPRSL